MTTPAAGRLRLVYRSYGGENTKNRPVYYSKLLALTSFIRAAEAVPRAEVIFLNDGPVPAERLALMEPAGAVRQIAAQAQGLRASYWHALTLPDRLGWDDSDVVFFVEDDYLFTADAFICLERAVTGLPEASYFSLYGTRPDYDDHDDRRRFSVPRSWMTQPARVVDGETWFNLCSTTSTFGARVGALRADLPVFRSCMRPFKKRFLDHETCVIYQGYAPYRPVELLTGYPDELVPSVRGVLRTVFLVPFRLALNVQGRRRTTPHYLYAVTPNKATHMEHPAVSPDRDWEAEASAVAEWASAQGRTSLSTRLRSPRTTSEPEGS